MLELHATHPSDKVYIYCILGAPTPPTHYVLVLPRYCLSPFTHKARYPYRGERRISRSVCWPNLKGNTAYQIPENFICRIYWMLYISTYACLCMCVCLCVYISMCAYFCLYVCVFLYVCICMSVCVCVFVRMSLCVCIRVCVCSSLQ